MNQNTITGIRSRILIPVIITTVVFLAAFVFVFNRNQQTNIEDNADHSAEQVQQLFARFLETETALLGSQLHFLTQSDALIEPFQQRDRDALLAAAEPIFADLNSDYRVTHFYFTDLDRVNFLRAHNPPKNGDTIGRVTQLGAESTGQLAAGIEFGASGMFTLRVVTPWDHNGQRIGYLELGMEIHHITQNLKDSLLNDLIFYVDKQYMDQSNWESGMEMLGRPANWDEFEHVAVIDSTLADTPAAITNDVIAQITEDAGFTKHVMVQDTNFSLHSIPLIDAGGRELGKVIVLTDVTDAQTALETSTLGIGVLVVVVGGLLIAFFYIYVGRIEHAQAGLFKELQTSNEEVQVRITEIETQRHELEQVNQEVERRMTSESQQREQLQGLAAQVEDMISDLNMAASEIQAATAQQLASATEQDASVTQTAATLDEVRVTVQQTAERAQIVATAAQQSVEVSQDGEDAVNNTVEGMELIRGRVENIAETILALSERTQQIGEIIETVNALADQSKLLALNASIEAARAGEEGRGFAVVAMEVRQLAEQSRQATARINDILSEIQQATNTAVMATEEGSKGAERGMELVTQAGLAIRDLAGTLDEVTQAAVQIAASTHQQINGMDQLSTAMQQIKQASTQSAASTRQVEQSARDLTSTAQTLDETAARYKLVS